MRNFICFILVSASLVLWGCNRKHQENKIRVATLKGPSAMGMIKMIDSINTVENASFVVNIYNEPLQIRKLMLENEVDFAVVPTTMGAILYNKGLPYQIAAIPVWGTLYLFGNDTTIKTWTDLKGKKINLMAKGMTPDVLFKYLLIQNGINPEEDVMLDYSFPTHIDLANAVAANQVNLAVISEPLVSLVMQKNKQVYPIFDLNKEWLKVNNNIPLAQTALMVKSGFEKMNPTGYNSFLSAYKNSTAWVNKNQDKAAELIVKYNILPDIEAARSSITRSNLNFIETKNQKTSINEYLKIFFEMNPDIIGGRMPDDGFYIKN